MLISVIIPVYNTENYIRQCLDSIIRQSYKNIQIIIIDDGSFDSTLTICEKYSTTDKRISVYHKDNGGVSSARNIGIGKALGEYIFFADADDELTEKCIENLVNMLKSNCDLVIGGHKVLQANNKQYRLVNEYIPPKFNGNIKDLLNNIDRLIATNSIQGPCSKLFRLEIIKKHQLCFPTDMSFGEDTFFVYEYLHYCKYAITFEGCDYLYFQRDINSLCSRIRKDKLDIYIALYCKLESLLEYFEIYDKKDVIEKNICSAVLFCIGEIYLRMPIIPVIERICFIKCNMTRTKIFGSFKNRRNSNVKIKLIYLLVSSKMFHILDLIFLIYRILKRRLDIK